MHRHPSVPQGYTNSDVASKCGTMLRDALRNERVRDGCALVARCRALCCGMSIDRGKENQLELNHPIIHCTSMQVARNFLTSGQVWPLIDTYVHLRNFEVASDAFASLKCVTTACVMVRCLFVRIADGLDIVRGCSAKIGLTRHFTIYVRHTALPLTGWCCWATSGPWRSSSTVSSRRSVLARVRSRTSTRRSRTSTSTPNHNDTTTQVFASYRRMLRSDNYVTKRQSLRLLEDILVDPHNFQVMYVPPVYLRTHGRCVAWMNRSRQYLSIPFDC